MKGVIFLAILLALVGAGIWCGVMKQAMSDEGIWILTAIGNPDGKKIEMVIAVEIGVTFRIPPRCDKDGNPLWDEWVSAHYEMRDETGKVTPGTRIAHTMLVDERLVKSVPDFFLQFFLEPGRNYALDYIPKAGGKMRYRHSFTAPPDTTPPERVVFNPIKK